MAYWGLLSGRLHDKLFPNPERPGCEYLSQTLYDRAVSTCPYPSTTGPLCTCPKPCTTGPLCTCPKPCTTGSLCTCPKPCTTGSLCTCPKPCTTGM